MKIFVMLPFLISSIPAAPDTFAISCNGRSSLTFVERGRLLKKIKICPNKFLFSAKARGLLTELCDLVRNLKSYAILNQSKLT